MTKGLLFVMLCVFSGCLGCTHNSQFERVSHGMKEFIMWEGQDSPDENVDVIGEAFSVISIAADETTTIKVKKTGEQLSAKPGETFARPDGTGPYGRVGLELLAASDQTQVACFRRYFARWSH